MYRIYRWGSNPFENKSTPKFTFEVKKLKDATGASFEAKFGNLDFKHTQKVYTLDADVSSPIHYEESAPVITRTYKVVESQGKFIITSDVHSNTYDESNPMAFAVTFPGFRTARVQRIFPAHPEFSHVALEYRVTQTQTSFGFENADELARCVDNINVLEFIRGWEANEALNVGIFMILLGAIGNHKIDVASANRAYEEARSQSGGSRDGSGQDGVGGGKDLGGSDSGGGLDGSSSGGRKGTLVTMDDAGDGEEPKDTNNNTNNKTSKKTRKMRIRKRGKSSSKELSRSSSDGGSGALIVAENPEDTNNGNLSSRVNGDVDGAAQVSTGATQDA